jgi:hypothetical protein
MLELGVLAKVVAVVAAPDLREGFMDERCLIALRVVHANPPVRAEARIGGVDADDNPSGPLQGTGIHFPE